MRIVATGAVLFRGRVRALDVLSAAEHVSVADHAKLRALHGNQVRRAAGVGHVENSAAAGLEGRMYFRAFELAQHVAVAVETELVLGLDENRFRIARVRAVATGAGAFSHRAVHGNFIKLFFLARMAGVTERLDRRVEKLGLFRAVRIVAGHALFGRKWNMDGLPFQVGALVLMAGETDIAAVSRCKQARIGRGVRVMA